METQESALTMALLTVPARAAICRALLEAGEEGLPAVDLAELAGLTLRRATHHFQEMVQAEILALAIRDRRVCYVLKARRSVREALDYVDNSGLN
ncbi:winged helix-turn-helix domain-containing protein [Cupriavidus sp. BIS7]|uniref:winged helix-turn-helix domain-containing protein n=1 Tax=Cupriavidus sp. BIS7 TaxID=1217718 RepID=UPI0002F2C69E|nr:winged helix-turn-helix domain-containing protein [Cupriavidus sp. BIS7]